MNMCKLWEYSKKTNIVKSYRESFWSHVFPCPEGTWYISNLFLQKKQKKKKMHNDKG